MSVEVRLSLGAQAVLDRRIRDLRLVQYSLSDMSADAMSRGMTVAAVKFADEADAIRQALNEVEAVLRVAQQNTTEGQDR